MTRALIVDDVRTYRTIHAQLLRKSYDIVDTAGTLSQAEQLLRLHRYDLVITDLRLSPDTPSIVVIQRIQVLSGDATLYAVSSDVSDPQLVRQLEAMGVTLYSKGTEPWWLSEDIGKEVERYLASVFTKYGLVGSAGQIDWGYILWLPAWRKRAYARLTGYFNKWVDFAAYTSLAMLLYTIWRYAHEGVARDLAKLFAKLGGE